VWTSPTSAHQMYKIERELYRHVNAPNFAKQLDEVDIAKQQVSYLLYCISLCGPNFVVEFLLSHGLNLISTHTTKL